MNRPQSFASPWHGRPTDTHTAYTAQRPYALSGTDTAVTATQPILYTCSLTALHLQLPLRAAETGVYGQRRTAFTLYRRAIGRRHCPENPQVTRQKVLHPVCYRLSKGGWSRVPEFRPCFCSNSLDVYDWASPCAGRKLG